MPRRVLSVLILSFIFVFALLFAVGATRAAAVQADLTEQVHSPAVCSPAIVVTSTLDSGVGTLRQAIAEVCTGGAITFNGDLTITLASELVVSQSLTIDGEMQAVKVSGNHATRVFNITATTGTVTFKRLTIADGSVQTIDCSGLGGARCGGGIMIQNGGVTVNVISSTLSGNSTPDAGGGIYNGFGTLQVINSTLSGNANTSGTGGGLYNFYGAVTVTTSTFFSNSSDNRGGGIYNYLGTVQVTDSLFSNNTSFVWGGGIDNDSGPLTVANSTFSGNRATVGQGGGIKNWSGALTVVNSTFSGNSAYEGGGILNASGTLTVTNSTFSGNSATYGYVGGLENWSGTTTITNSIVANSPAGGNCSGITGGTNNLADDGSCGTGFNESSTILMGPLGNYGGSTPTLPLLPGSSAINATSANCPATDQRGIARGATCDLGAFESQGFTLTKVGGDNQSALLNTTFTNPLSVTVTSAYTEPVNGGVITFGGPLIGASLNPITTTATITNGAVSQSVTANSLVGSYPVTVSVTGATSIVFALQNLPPMIAYAKPGGLSSGICDSWANACELRYAITSTVSGQEIWVAAGTYQSTATTTDRSATFQLKGGVSIYGGFAATETLRTQRNPAANLTILSGDIDHNDSQTPIITDLNTVTGNTTNSYNVVIGATGATLDGFVVTSGYANGSNWPNYAGGGLFSTNSSPTVTNITFSGNWANQGGGMYNYNASNPTVMTVTFSGNLATYGGGLVNYLDSNPIVVNATFSGNTAVSEGGGVFNGNHSRPTLRSITFTGNSATVGGGMQVTTGSSVTLTQATFSGNSATYGGGLAANGNGSVLTNVTFYSNTAGEFGGGLFNVGGAPLLTNVTFNANSAGVGGGMYNLYSAPLIRNSILWGDRGGEVENLTSTLTISNSIVQGGYVSGTNILDTDPRLGALGDFGGGTSTIPLLPGSPAIDGADTNCPVADQRGVLRGAICDIGAFESQGFTLMKASGDNQSTPANTAFAQPLVISVTSAYSEPVNGGVVTFVGPLSGASTKPITATATITNGAVAHSLIANGLPGSYPVEVHANGATSIIFTLTNIARIYLPLMAK